MPVSKVGAATRAFVAVLLALARGYQLALHVNRDSDREQLLKAYKRVLLKVHPDKGGSKADTQKLTMAKETWDKAFKGSAPQGGRPSGADGTLVCKAGGKDISHP